MSLTSLLKDKNSPLAKFMKETFPDTSQLLKYIRSDVKNYETLRPRHRNYSLVGTAIDYRIRFFFEKPYEYVLLPGSSRLDLVARSIFSEEEIKEQQKIREQIAEERGISTRGIIFFDPETLKGKSKDIFDQIMNQNHIVATLGVDKLPDDYFSQGKAFLNDFGEWLKNYDTRELLTAEEERTLARFTAGLSYFDIIYRSGRVDDLLLKLLKTYETRDFTQGFLKSISNDVVNDLVDLSTLFFNKQQDLLQSKNVHLNPTFDGSCKVGGADADLILDGMLTEIKTTINPQSYIKQDAIYQLLGYLLLDINDEYAISSIAIYFARQGYCWSMDLNKVFKICKSPSMDVKKLREIIIPVLDQCEKYLEEQIS